jgi:hypothetical protein
MAVSDNPNNTSEVESIWDTPQVQANIEYCQRTFVQYGIMAAFPLCFPGATTAIVHDDSRITTLDLAPDRKIYGGTSGHQAHLFVGMLHGATGCVLDLGILSGASESIAVCCGERHVIAAANGPEGGLLFRRRLESQPPDLLQEWFFERKPLEALGLVASGEPIVHAIADSTRRFMIGITGKQLFSVEFKDPLIKSIASVSGATRLALDAQNCVIGVDGNHQVWSYDPLKDYLQFPGHALPAGKWDLTALRWARDPRDGRLYTADASGQLYSYHPESGFTRHSIKAPLCPVGPMAILPDGRMIGACGDEMANFFVYDPQKRSVENIGVAISILQNRRYGYLFGDVVVTENGHLVFGENDNSGHLWLHFPPILSS